MQVVHGGHQLRALKEFTEGKVRMFVIDERHIKPDEWISWIELGQSVRIGLCDES